MELTDQVAFAKGSVHDVGAMVNTTLYELIEAINEELEPEDDWLVTDTVLDLIETGKIK